VDVRKRLQRGRLEPVSPPFPRPLLRFLASGEKGSGLPVLVALSHSMTQLDVAEPAASLSDTREEHITELPGMHVRSRASCRLLGGTDHAGLADVAYCMKRARGP
jgi:hypothetical protein